MFAARYAGIDILRVASIGLCASCRGSTYLSSRVVGWVFWELGTETKTKMEWKAIGKNECGLLSCPADIP